MYVFAVNRHPVCRIQQKKSLLMMPVIMLVVCEILDCYIHIVLSVTEKVMAKIL